MTTILTYYELGMLLPISWLFLAFAYRLRGSGTILDDNEEVETAAQRVMFWSVPLFMFTMAYLQDPFMGLCIGIAGFLSMLMPHGAYFGLGGYTPNRREWLGRIIGYKGKRKSTNYWLCVKAMAIIGFLRGSIILAGVQVGNVPFSLNPWVYAFPFANAVLEPAVYMIAWKVYGMDTDPKEYVRNKFHFTKLMCYGPIALAELLRGLFYAIGLTLIFLWGI